MGWERGWVCFSPCDCPVLLLLIYILYVPSRTDAFRTQSTLHARVCGGPQLFQRPAHPFTSSLPTMLPGRLELHVRMCSELGLFSHPFPEIRQPQFLSVYSFTRLCGFPRSLFACRGWEDMVEQIRVENRQERVTARHSSGGPASSDLPPQPGHLPPLNSALRISVHRWVFTT